MPTIYFGALVCLAMLGGLGGNLVVLPLLLSWFPPQVDDDHTLIVDDYTLIILVQPPRLGQSRLPRIGGDSDRKRKPLTVNGLPLVLRRLRGTTKQRRGVRPRGFMPGQAAFV